MKRLFYALSILFALVTVASAQPDLTTITGTLYRPGGAACNNCSFQIAKVRKGGVVVADRPVTVTSNGSGAVTFTALRQSLTTIKGDFTIGKYNFRTGVEMYIPDAETADFDDLVSGEDALLSLVGALPGGGGGGGGGGSGTVTSIALSLPNIFTVSGSPVTSSGTLTGALATQTANRVFAGPTTGSAAAPTFRALVAADIPSLSSIYAALAHTHPQSDITNLVTDLAGKAAASHVHAIADVTGLQIALDGKQATGNYITALTGDVTAAGPGSSAATIANNAVSTAKIASGAVTFAKIQNVSTAKLLGRASTGTGVVEEITLGTNLSLTGTTLNATGGGSGIDLGWYVATDHGLVGDGVTDDTAALQALINTVATAGGGTIYFPKGVYLIAGALQDTSGANAQIIIPQRADSVKQITINLVGEVEPPTQFYTGAVIPDGTTHSVIKSTLTGAGGTAALFQGKVPGGSLFNNVMFNFRNLVIQVPPNPTFTAISLLAEVGGYIDRVLIHAGALANASITQPTNSNNFGVKMPPTNHSARAAVDGLVVVGQYIGMLSGELTDAAALFYGCTRALYVPNTYHASVWRFFGAYDCTYNIVASATGIGDTPVLRMLVADIQHANGTGQGWQDLIADVQDSGNILRGEIHYLTVEGGLGRENIFTKVGGNNLRCLDLSNLPSLPSAAPTLASLEIGNVSSATVVAVFDQEIKAPNYATGVTINVDGVPATISSAARQATKTTIHFALAAPVVSGEDVAFNYSAVDGFLQNEPGVHVADIIGAVVTNNVPPPGSGLLDTFTDTDGTLLPAHTMDLGTGWSEVEAGSLKPTIQSNKVQTQLDISTGYTYLADSGLSDVTAEGDFTFGVWGDGGHYNELIIRAVDGNNYWKLTVNANSSAANMKIVRYQAGVDNVEQSTTITLTAGVSYHFQATASGNNISFTVNGVTLNHTSSFNNTATKCGFRLYHAFGAANTLDNFSVSP